jgi:hypothetical protein
MRLPSAAFPHLLRHKPEIAPRTRAAVRRGFHILLGTNQPIRARYRLPNPAEVAQVLNRVQEELS